MKILILGGDKRQRILCGLLKKNGYNAEHYFTSEDFSRDFSEFEVIILPYPASRDKITLFNTLCSDKITLKEINDKISTQKVLTGGKYDIKNSVNYAESETLTMLNAVPTAEGAIACAITNTDITVWQSKILVIGNGRIGKVLSQRLRALGADVTVSARKEQDLAYIEAFGCRSIQTDKIAETANEYDIVFNTVPARVIDEDTLCRFKSGALIIDLASAPYGLDFDAAKRNGVKSVLASALPGKTAPETAALILEKVITQYI